MNEKLIVVLLLVTIVLSVTSLAIVSNITDFSDNFARALTQQPSQPTQSASVGFTIEKSTAGGTG